MEFINGRVLSHYWYAQTVFLYVLVVFLWGTIARAVYQVQLSKKTISRTIGSLTKLISYLKMPTESAVAILEFNEESPTNMGVPFAVVQSKII